MNYRLNNIITLVLTVLAVYIAIPWENKPVLNRTFVKGLDLQGGSELVLQLQDEGEIEDMDEATQNAVNILTRRIDRFGLTQPRIQRQGNNKISVQLPGMEEGQIERVKEILTTTGNLEFYLEASQVDYGKSSAPDDPAPGTIWKRLPPDSRGAGSGSNSEYILLEEEPVLDGKYVKEAEPVASRGGPGGGPYNVSLDLTAEGGDKFAEITSENQGKSLAIVLDGNVKSAPNIQEPITGGVARITGSFSPEDAKNLSNILNSGKLAAPLEIISENTVGPTLGEDSIQNGTMAVGWALALILLFMAFYYWGLGLIANFVLILNLLLLVSIMNLLEATLTLPGIAGILLTVGMAVDASVIIFERIREEHEKDQSARKTFETSWNKAFWAVFDANTTTLIAAVILFYFGSGPIKGFATTLFIGICTTLFSVFFCEKALIRGAVEAEIMKDFGMFEWFSGTDFSFLSKFSITVFVSLLLIVGSIGIFAYGAAQGGRIFSIEFMGGTLVNMRFEKPVSVDFVRENISDITIGEEEFHPYRTIEVQSVGRNESEQSADPNKGKQFQIRLKGDRFDQLVRHYFQRDLRNILTEVDVEEVNFRSRSSALVQLSSEVSVGDVRKKIQKFRYAESFIAPYTGLRIKLPGDEPGEESEGRTDVFEARVTRNLVQNYIKNDLLRTFDRLSKVPLAVLPSEDRFKFRVALKKEQPAKEVTQRIRSLFRNNGIQKRPLVKPEEGEAKIYTVTSHPDTTQEVENKIEQIFSDIRSGGEEGLTLSEGPFNRVNDIGASVAESLKRDAFWAIFLSWAAIVIYLALRFQFTYGIGAVIALVHDVIICVGIVALVDLLLPPGLGVNLDIGISSLAAFLTVIGYSVNDTIVTYDRIRELVRESRKLTFQEIIDQSINLNLSRTVLTSVTTFIAAAILFGFTATSGSDVASFAFPIIVGVIAGTYSSMFVACPVLVHAPLIGREKNTRASHL